jgi:hypothetical protein
MKTPNSLLGELIFAESSRDPRAAQYRRSHPIMAPAPSSVNAEHQNSRLNIGATAYCR